MLQFLINLRIRVKVFAICAILLTILVGLAVSDFVNFRRAERAFGAVGQSATESQSLAAFNIEFLQLRRFSRDYIFTGSPAARTGGEAEMKAVEDKLTQAMEVVREPTRRQQVAQMVQMYHDYLTQIRAGYALRSEMDSIFDSNLATHGVAAQIALSSLSNSAKGEDNAALASMSDGVLMQVMQVRLTLVQMLRHMDPSEAAGLDKLITTVTLRLQVMGNVDKGESDTVLYTGASEAMQAYATGATRVIEILTRIDHDLNPAWTRIGDSIARSSDAITQAVKTEHATVSATTAAMLARARILTVVLAAAGLGLGIAVAWLVGGGIARPVMAMSEVMHRLAGGEHGIAIPATDRRDEVGEMAKAVLVFQRNAVAAARLAAEKAETDATREARSSRLTELLHGFEAQSGKMVGEVATAAEQLTATATDLAEVAGRSTEQSAAVATAAEEAAVNTGTAATAAEELAASIAEISRQVDSSTRIAARAQSDAEHTDTIVRALAEGSQKIGEVVSLISDIAGQTNLLALNATIEAARAGEAGRGFAVVASEVKRLANQTAHATGDIAAQIGQVQTTTQEAVTAIRAISATIGEINKITASIAAAVEEQGSATEEIARTVGRVSAGTNTMTGNVTELSHGASRTSEAVSRLRDAAGQLSTQAETLSSEVSTFLASVRAA